MTRDGDIPADGERRESADRRSEDRADRRVCDRPDRRAHARYTPVGMPPHRSDRRQGERRRADH